MTKQSCHSLGTLGTLLKQEELLFPGALSCLLDVCQRFYSIGTEINRMTATLKVIVYTPCKNLQCNAT